VTEDEVIEQLDVEGFPGFDELLGGAHILG
jgi:hypothetical protein